MYALDVTFHFKSSRRSSMPSMPTFSFIISCCGLFNILNAKERRWFYFSPPASPPTSFEALFSPFLVLCVKHASSYFYFPNLLESLAVRTCISLVLLFPIVPFNLMFWIFYAPTQNVETAITRCRGKQDSYPLDRRALHSDYLNYFTCNLPSDPFARCTAPSFPARGRSTLHPDQDSLRYTAASLRIAECSGTLQPEDRETR